MAHGNTGKRSRNDNEASTSTASKASFQGQHLSAQTLDNSNNLEGNAEHIDACVHLPKDSETSDKRKLCDMNQSSLYDKAIQKYNKTHLPSNSSGLHAGGSGKEVSLQKVHAGGSGKGLPLQKVKPEEVIVEFKYQCKKFSIYLSANMDFDQFRHVLWHRVKYLHSVLEVPTSWFLSLYRVKYLDISGCWVTIVCKEDYQCFWKYAAKQPFVKIICEKRILA